MKKEKKVKKIVSGRIIDGRRASTFGSCGNTRVLSK
jgi:hypothetical protein